MDLTLVNITIAMAAGVGVAGYVAYILVPAWGSYGRTWERVAASFLTLFILVTLLGVGLAIGLSIVWFYDSYA
jgi:hypothetical protein